MSAAAVRSLQLAWASPQAKQLLHSLATSSDLEGSSAQGEIRLLYKSWMKQVDEVSHARVAATLRQYRLELEKHGTLPALAAAAATQIE